MLAGSTSYTNEQMPVARIPLAGSFNQRTIDGHGALEADQDQRFLNCAFSVIENPITGSRKIYVEKRPGWRVESIVAANNVSTGLIKTDSFGSAVTAFGATNSTIYDGQVSVGAITGRAMYFTETLLSNVGYVLIKSSDGTGWYYTSDAKSQTSYTGDTTNTSAIVTNIASTSGMYSGQAISGAGIPAGTRILTVDSSTQITLNANATATAAGVTLTKTPVAKILDADFVTTGSTVTAFVEMDGYQFYGNADGYIYNSDLNSVTAYTSTGKVAAQMSPDPPNAVARHKNLIIGWGHSSMEAFYNAGNASGSPLTRAAQFFSRTGALDQRSVATLADDIYFVSSAKYGEVSVVRLRNLAPQQVSSPEVNKLLGTVIATGGYVYLSAFQLGGYPYVSTFATIGTDDTDLLLMETGEELLLETNDSIVLEADPNASAAFARMLVYNAAINLWSEWDCDEATFVAGIGSGGINQLIATSRVKTDGKVYTIKPAADGASYTDDGSAYSTEIRTARIDHGTESRKFVKCVRLVADDQSSGTVTLEASDDDYDSWTTLGTFDLTKKDKRIYRCGSYRGGRAYRLTHSTAAPFRAEALEIEYDIGTV
jgi:hypothetical protein